MGQRDRRVQVTLLVSSKSRGFVNCNRMGTLKFLLSTGIKLLVAEYFRNCNYYTFVGATQNDFSNIYFI